MLRQVWAWLNGDPRQSNLCSICRNIFDHGDKIRKWLEPCAGASDATITNFCYHTHPHDLATSAKEGCVICRRFLLALHRSKRFNAGKPVQIMETGLRLEVSDRYSFSGNRSFSFVIDIQNPSDDASVPDASGTLSKEDVFKLKGSSVYGSWVDPSQHSQQSNNKESLYVSLTKAYDKPGGLSRSEYNYGASLRRYF